MKKPKHNMKELRALQALPLEEKILRSQMKVEEFYEHYKGKICVSFSGGKDSTVLLHLVRTVHPEVKGVFVNTGLEYPEVYNHVLATENVDVIKPALRFREV